jgi:hypothetical protein
VKSLLFVLYLGRKRSIAFSTVTNVVTGARIGKAWDIKLVHRDKLGFIQNYGKKIVTQIFQKKIP